MRPYLLVITILMLIIWLPTMGQNDAQIDQQKRVIAALEKQITAQEREISKIKQGRTATEDLVKQLAQQIDSRNQLLDAQQKQARLLTSELRRKNIASDSLNRNLVRNKEHYAQMVREAYRNYKHENYLTYIFAARDFTDIARKISNLRHVAEMRRNKLSEIENLSTRVAHEKKVLGERKKALDSVTTQLKTQRTKLERDARTARANVKRMSQQEKQKLQQKIAREQQLNVAIDELRKLSRGNKEGDSFSNKTAGLRLPVAAGRVRRYMGNMAEITGPKGASVNSIYDGKVVEVKRNRITNKFDVYIAHGEYLTSYANLGTIEVEKGQKITKNQQIGTIGSSVNINTMEPEYKLVFGIYSPSPTETMRAENCFRR